MCHDSCYNAIKYFVEAYDDKSVIVYSVIFSSVGRLTNMMMSNAHLFVLKLTEPGIHIGIRQ